MTPCSDLSLYTEIPGALVGSDFVGGVDREPPRGGCWVCASFNKVLDFKVEKGGAKVIQETKLEKKSKPENRTFELD